MMNPTDPNDLIKRILAATAPEHVFGGLSGAVPGDKRAQLAGVTQTFRQMVRVIHPDICTAPASHEAFVKLAMLRDGAEYKVKAGTYGDPTAPVVGDVSFASKKGRYVLGDKFAEGDLATVYRGRMETPSGYVPVAIKVAGHPRDNDLVQHEAEVLAKVFPQEEATVGFFRYLPRLLDSFTVRGPGGDRRANVFELYDGFYSLAEVRAAHPDGLGMRQVVWMMKRALAGLGFIHRQGLVHGAMVPMHVLVDPVAHGAKLVDWCYVVQTGQPLKAISAPYRSSYPAEVLDKKPAGPSTDLYMLGRMLEGLLGPNPPDYLRGFISTFTLANPARRPEDAWKLHEELDDLLLRVVGKPKYVALDMPPRAP